MITEKNPKVLEHQKININDCIKFNKKLPQIILPSNKIKMFLEWYNADLRFQDNIPEAFNEGYIKVENNLIQLNLDNYSKYISGLAKELHTTYRTIYNKLNYFIECLENITMHFTFKNKEVLIYLYGKDNRIVSKISFLIGPRRSRGFKIRDNKFY